MKIILTIQPASWFTNPSMKVAFSEINNAQHIDQAIQALQQLKDEKIVTKHFKVLEKCKQK